MFNSAIAAPILAFAAVAAALVLTPGVGTAFLTSTVVAHGRRAGFQTAAGMVVGAAIHALAAAAGTVVLLREFPRALTWIAIVGGSFIIWLGGRGIVRAIRNTRPGGSATMTTPPGRHSFAATGMFIALGNAPLPLFYLVVVPQYIPRDMSRIGGAALLSVIHLAMAGAWMATVVHLVGRLAEVLRRPRVLAGLQIVTGTALVLLGIKSVAGAV